MKKIVCSIFSLLCIGMACYALPTSSVLLQHQGNVVVYPLDSLNAALRDAADGDTLFLSKGVYPGFTIDKKITVRGAGQKTIAEEVTIAIPDSATLTQTVLEGINVGGMTGQRAVLVTSQVSGLKIKQCYFDRIDFSGGAYHDVLIDRCMCLHYFNLPSNVKSMIVKNSRIGEVHNTEKTSTQISFINCNIRSWYYYWHSYLSDFKGSFINCILGAGSAQTPLICTVINTFINANVPLQGDEFSGFEGSAYAENIYKEEGVNNVIKNNSAFIECIYSDDELMEKGYVGNDGTVIGTGGGMTPYTLELAVPKVQSSDIKLDNENRKLNVNLILTAE